MHARKNDDLVAITDSCRSTVTIQHNNLRHFCVALFYEYKTTFFSVYIDTMLFGVIKWLVYNQPCQKTSVFCYCFFIIKHPVNIIS